VKRPAPGRRKRGGGQRSDERAQPIDGMQEAHLCSGVVLQGGDIAVRLSILMAGMSVERHATAKCRSYLERDPKAVEEVSEDQHREGRSRRHDCIRDHLARYTQREKLVVC
jgi:hypothetical protein